MLGMNLTKERKESVYKDIEYRSAYSGLSMAEKTRREIIEAMAGEEPNRKTRHNFKSVVNQL